MISDYPKTVPETRTVINSHAKTVAEVVADLKEELKEFLNTRLGILRAEMTSKLQRIKMATPMLVIGLVLLWTAWLAFTAFLVCIIAQAFLPSSWAYVLSFIIVAFGYGIAGGVAASIALKGLKETGLKLERTLRVLQQDRVWLQTEAKTQI